MPTLEGKGTFIQNDSVLDDLLLNSALQLGIDELITINRRILFCYYQTQFNNVSEETLQRTIEKSAFWLIKKRGVYCLSKEGLKKMKELFPFELPEFIIPTKFRFAKIISGQEYSISSDNKQGFNRKNVQSQISKLEKIGEHFETKSTALTTRLLNWILRENDFYWTMEYEILLNPRYKKN